MQIAFRTEHAYIGNNGRLSRREEDSRRSRYRRQEVLRQRFLSGKRAPPRLHVTARCFDEGEGRPASASRDNVTFGRRLARSIPPNRCENVG